jgi:hypothetical protein
MAIKTTYQCDKCNKEWDPKIIKEQMCTVAVGVSFNCAEINFSNLHREQWCRTCVMEVGLSEPIDEADKKVAPITLLSFKDKIIMLVNKLGFYQNN